MSIYDVFSGGSKPFDKAEWAAQSDSEGSENQTKTALIWKTKAVLQVIRT